MLRYFQFQRWWHWNLLFPCLLMKYCMPQSTTCNPVLYRHAYWVFFRNEREYALILFYHCFSSWIFRWALLKKEIGFTLFLRVFWLAWFCLREYVTNKIDSYDFVIHLVIRCRENWLAILSRFSSTHADSDAPCLHTTTDGLSYWVFWYVLQSSTPCCLTTSILLLLFDSWITRGTL